MGVIINGGQQWCTGSVIAPQWVLTAAHCIAENLQFGIGPNMNQLSEQVQVAQTFIHPHYSDQTLAHDVALLKLAAPVSAQPLALVRSINTAVDHRSLLVGYGVDNGRGQTGNGTKRRTEVTFSEFTRTEMIYRNFRTNSCNGDSGGPAFFYGGGNTLVVAGITSSAADAADQFCEMGGRYMRVDSYLDYISEVMAGGAVGENVGNQPEQPGQDEQARQECVDWDGDGWCDEQPGQGNGQGDQQECVDWDGDGWCDEPCEDRDGDGWCDATCDDWDGDGWCD
ncbi:MAG: trypsin-like serine protease [Myxococcota bacterium]|nr:trypsin-like serine protease [Myxococcota bacterium]